MSSQDSSVVRLRKFPVVSPPPNFHHRSPVVPELVGVPASPASLLSPLRHYPAQLPPLQSHPRSIAAELDKRKVETPRGGSWHPQFVKRIVQRLAI